MRQLPTWVLVVIWAALPGAFEVTLSPRAIQDAIDIGQSALETVRQDHHRTYRIQLAKPPVDYVEVVTPFRRITLAAETQRRAGNRFGQRDAIAVLDASPRAVTLVVEMTFHPQNRYVGMPLYDVRLLARRATVATVEIASLDRVPRYGPRMPGLPVATAGPPAGVGAGQPVLGGSLMVTVDGGRVDPRGTYDLLVLEGQSVIADATLDFGALR
jgi:hypothetical protein